MAIVELRARCAAAETLAEEHEAVALHHKAQLFRATEGLEALRAKGMEAAGQEEISARMEVDFIENELREALMALAEKDRAIAELQDEALVREAEVVALQTGGARVGARLVAGDELALRERCQVLQVEYDSMELKAVSLTTRIDGPSTCPPKQTTT